MKTLIVGDIHGRINLVNAAFNWLEGEGDRKVVFVGDYLDSFDESVRDQIKCLDKVLRNICVEDKTVVGLRGNHENSYLHPMDRCSGYRQATQEAVNVRHDAMIASLDHYTWVGSYLVSHAGVSQSLLDALGIMLHTYLTEGKFSDVGRARGGPSPCGGLYWCDWFEEFEPIPDVPQIVGHSGYRMYGEYTGILQKGNSYNVDCYSYRSESLVVLADGISTEVINLEEWI